MLLHVEWASSAYEIRLNGKVAGYCQNGSNPADYNFTKQVREGDVYKRQGYGMTECAPLISFTPDNEFKAGSCGRFLSEFIQVKIDSPDPEHVAGEILVHGEHVMICLLYTST